ILRRFSAQHGADLNLRAGIDVGTVTSGLVGRRAVIYDLWGDAVNLAFRLQGGAAGPGIFVSQAVADKVADLVEVADAGRVETKPRVEPVWRIEPDVLEPRPAGG